MSVDKQLGRTSFNQADGPGAGGGGWIPKKMDRGVGPASQNPYPIYDQNLVCDFHFPIYDLIYNLFMTLPKIPYPIYDLILY